MPKPTEDILEFQCPKCMKRLKAGAKTAGRRVKCPKCQQAVRVPGVQPTVAPAVEDDWLALDTPAIGDVSARELAAAEVKAKKSAERTARRRANERASAQGPPADRSPQAVSSRNTQSSRAANPPAADSAQAAASPNSTPAADDRSTESSDDDFSLAPLESSGRPKAKPQPAKPSVFDDDLPELSELEPKQALPPARGNDDLDGLDGLIPDLDDASLAGSPLPPLLDEPEDTTDHEYRIACKVCGTAQYVRLSAKGMKIKCPDCLSDFKVPGPPAGWTPKKAKKKLELSNEDFPLAEADQRFESKAREGKQSLTSSMLAKAEQEVSDEDLERLYDGDFDTAGFLRRTFGFLTDPVAVSFVIGYGIVFAMVFALAQYGLNNRDSGFGRGALLLGMIGAPLIGILFGLPMLSSALALLESVANRQKRVNDWPGFDMFDNFGDLLAIAIALVASLLPGFLIGFWLGGDEAGAGRIQLTGMMISSFLLFPIFMLSILDNGSLLQPISGAVISSLKQAAEAWGGYFLKTMIMFSTTMLLWYILLGADKPPFQAAIGGFLLSPLVFFTFQQLGALADAISEHLSFEFTPSNQDEDDAEGDANEIES